MIGHLGHRVSALLDGQLGVDEEQRAWDHVHGCHACRDQVEREGWVKTQLATLSFVDSPTPRQLRGTLLGASASDAPGTAYLITSPTRHRTRAALGGGAVGAAAVFSLLALGTAPAAAPVRTPATSLVNPTAAAGVNSVVSTPTGASEMRNQAQRARSALSRVTMLW